MSPKIVLNTPHINQQIIIDSEARFRVVACGRRFGKSETAKNIAIEKIFRGQHLWFCSPTFKNSERMFRQFLKMLKSLPSELININRTNMRIELLWNDGWIEFVSLHDPDNLRGEGLDFLIIDEAAFITGHAWDEVLAPMLLSDTGGALFISSTNGMNWFYKIYMMGLDPEEDEWGSFHFTTFDNPFLKIKELNKIRKRTSRRVFDREYMAVFEQDGGAVFQNVDGCIESPPHRVIPVEPKGPIIFGIDWGQMRDYTLVIVFDTDSKSVLDYKRWNRELWATMRERIVALSKQYDPIAIFAESNHAGANIESLEEAGLPMQRFKTTTQSKPMIINKLALAFENNDIIIPNDELMISELKSFASNITEMGNIQYRAPSGMHDDIVIALAIAVNGDSMIYPGMAFEVISI